MCLLIFIMGQCLLSLQPTICKVVTEVSIGSVGVISYPLDDGSNPTATPTPTPTPSPTLTPTGNNLAPMFQGGTCDWGNYNQYGFFYPDQGQQYSYLAQRDSNVKHNGHDSIRIDGQGIPNSIYNRPEIDHPWITARAGQHVHYAYWVKTASSAIGAGAIIGMDAYGWDGAICQRIFEVHAGGTFTYPYTGTPDYLPYGSDWTYLVLDFTVPSTYFTKTDCGVTVNPQQIVGFIPFLGCSWNSGESAPIWFADGEFYVS
jgi:hypothetical protein